VIPAKTKAGDLITVPGGWRKRTGEICFIPVGRLSVLVCWQDTGRTTLIWPGADARYQHRDLAELEAPRPRRPSRRRPAEPEQSAAVPSSVTI
jgi:hypothetical protein